MASIRNAMRNRPSWWTHLPHVHPPPSHPQPHCTAHVTHAYDQVSAEVPAGSGLIVWEARQLRRAWLAALQSPCTSGVHNHSGLHRAGWVGSNAHRAVARHLHKARKGGWTFACTGVAGAIAAAAAS
jgi:hypothetical protein